MSRTITETVRRTLQSDKGQLFCTIGDNRYLLAKCSDVDIDIVERAEHLYIGGSPARVLSTYFSIVLCDDMTFMREYDSEYLSTVRTYDFIATLQRKDGVFEDIVLNNATLLEVDMTAERWTFRIDAPKELMTKLRTKF